MPDERPFQKGEHVRATCSHGHAVVAEVLLASNSGASLALGFDALAAVPGGVYARLMAVLRDEQGVYRDLGTGTEITLERLERAAGSER